MNDGEAFIDYYAVLQVSPACDARMLESAYRHLAKMYHPDHPETADADRFNAVVTAYRILRHPDMRAEYDRAHALHVHAPTYELPPVHDAIGEDRTALDDNEAHARILTMLYKKRRENALSAGVAGFYLRQMLGCSDELFDFHRWYLKAKGWIAISEQGEVEITIEGVDHVISMSRTSAVEKLLIGRPTDLSDRDDSRGDDNDESAGPLH